MLRKSFNFSPAKISFTLHTMAGVTYEGAFLLARYARLRARIGLNSPQNASQLASRHRVVNFPNAATRLASSGTFCQVMHGS